MALTREQIIEKWDGMAPRDRDEWVAEAVMRWEWYIPDGYDPVGWYSIATECYTGKGDEWSPTTNISAAWEVFEQMKEEEYRPTLNLAGELSGGVISGVAEVGDYHCNFRKDYVSNNAYRKSMPEAICLAALIAKLCGGEKSGNPN